MSPLTFIIFLFVYNINSAKTPCPVELTIDITDGKRVGSDIVKDDMRFDSGDYFVDNGTVLGCFCKIKKPCIRKCCGPNQIMNGVDCSPSDFQLNYTTYNGSNPTDSQKHNFIHRNDCQLDQILLTPHLDPRDSFYIQPNGSLFLPHYGNRQMVPPEEYCIEVFNFEQLSMNHTMTVMLCLSDKKVERVPIHNVIGMIISIPFLLMTFVVYALLPDRNLHMKALMFYVINLLLSYLLLVIIQLSDTRFTDGICIPIGYACLFFFLVSFFWMNVICFDIWLTFSGLRGFSAGKKVAGRKRFLLYCLYAWGMPVLHVVLIVIIHNTAETHAWYNPGIGEDQCFLNKGYPVLLYFYSPMGIIITINVVLFAITAFKIRSIKKDTSMLKKEDSKRHSYENDKQTFNLYLKLLFAMGVNWSMEIISWAVNWAGDAPDFIWYLTDFCNAIYGVFIFFIFVFKKSIWKLLKKRYYSFMGKSNLAHSTTMSNTTRVTSYSRPIRQSPTIPRN